METLRINIASGDHDIAIDVRSLARPSALGIDCTADGLQVATIPAAAQAKSGYTKILADGTRIPGTDPRTDHVAVIDHAAGLMWSVESLGSESDPDEGLDHAGCIARCASLRLLDHDDWRLPARAELVRLIDDTRRAPAIDTGLFPRVKPKWYWTSTPWIESDGNASASVAWFVDFHDGLVYSDYHRGGRGFALAVRRAGQ